MRVLRTLNLLLLALLPSAVKVRILRLAGHEIGPGAKIGCSFVDVKRMKLGAGARIGFGNVFKGMQYLELGDRTSIGRFNLFTCDDYYRRLRVHGILRR